ncbi:hypothetical protein [Paenibacillus sp. FSL R5-0914]|uniref:hypothetical protein n=1 Tax=Paenibacillus sp. FSL R5-0914 TaxID=2921665 RepID=UPI0030FAC432
MSKTPSDVRGSKERSLRLDLLELITAVRLLRESGHESQGYLCVIYDSSKKNLDLWNQKYHGVDFVKIIQPRLTPTELIELNQVKIILSKSKGGATSKAWKSKIIGEMNLSYSIIKELGPTVLDCLEEKPLGVNWDYFGVIL